MPIPPNNTAATATVISSLPFTDAQNVHNAGTTYDAWYKYTAVDGDFMIGAWGFGGTVGAGYQPQTFLYGPDSFTTVIQSTGNNRPMQFLVEIGKTYYIKFTRGGPIINPSDLAVSILRGPLNTTAPIGSILDLDDNDGSIHPATIIPSSDVNDLMWIVGLPPSEDAFILDNGIFITNDKRDGILKIFNSDFTLVTAVTGIPSTSISAVTGDKIDTFYAISSTFGVSSQVWKITSAGIVTGPISTIDISGTGGNTRSIAVSPDESILYYKVYPGSDYTKIRRHNILTDTPMSNLTDGPAGYSQGVREILCLKDGTIIVPYASNIGTPNDYKIIRYNPNGSIASTYTNPGGFSFPGTMRPAHAIDDPNSFWIWYIPTEGDSVFLNVKVSDGSILNTITGHQYEVGEYLGTVVTNPIRFGHSESCPLIILRTEVGEPPFTGIPGAGIYELVPGKRNDTIYTDPTTGDESGEMNVKIPNPFGQTTYIGS